MSVDLESLLVDPETREPVRRATDAQLEQIKRRMSGNGARRHDGGPLPFALDGAFLSRDGKLAYPIVDSIPWMLVDLRLELSTPID